MFCPKCGTQIAEDATFCSSCGAKIVTNSVEVKPASEDTNSKPQTSEQKPAPSPQQKRGPKLPLVIVAILLAALAALFALNHFGVVDVKSMLPFLGGSQQEESSSTPKQEESSDSSEEADVNQESSDTQDALPGNSSEDTPSSSHETTATAQSDNPQDSIKVSDLDLAVDAGGRYVITGKLTNSGSMEYSPSLRLTAIKHDKDKYGEETMEETTQFGLISATGTVGCESNQITMWQLQPGETREFTVYPEKWSSSNITYSDLKAEVTEVTLPASVLSHLGSLVDTGELFEVSALDYSHNGVVSGTITNNSGTYIASASVSFVMLDGNGEPAPSYSKDTRPSGAKLAWTSVEALKPGDTAKFEMNVGEGYSSAKFLDVAYIPDESKNKLG